MIISYLKTYWFPTIIILIGIFAMVMFTWAAIDHQNKKSSITANDTLTCVKKEAIIEL